MTTSLLQASFQPSVGADTTSSDGSGHLSQQVRDGPEPPILQPAESQMPYLSTEPAPNQSWTITLKDKVIAITGANRGIGLGVAQVCLENAASKVYSLDLMEPGEDFTLLAKKHPNFQWIQTDVTNDTSIEAALDKIIETEGRFDGMVANAGITKHQPALDFSREEVLKLFNLNVFGAFACAQIAARKFIKLGIKGSIVFTASMTSYRPNRAAPSAPYGATKGAVRNMTHTLAVEWAKHGIRVNSISPGFVRTAMTYYVEKAPVSSCYLRRGDVV